MTGRILLAVMMVCGVFLAVASCSETPTREQPSPTSTATDSEQSPAPGNTPSAEVDLPLYEQVIAGLRAKPGLSGVVIEDVHPIHTVFNREAIIPPQCYTLTEGQHNPCYVCHQDHMAGRENTMNDGALQVAYSFSDLGMTNHWSNLFEDRSARIAQISDREILDWVGDDNYSALAGRLEQAEFKGWIPDLANLQLGAGAFDEHGFARDGSGWVAFNYKPLPSTFWPTNGSTDDVMIRLPQAYQSDSEGKASKDVYRANLAILEAVVKGYDRISTLPVDERSVGRDLNGDHKLSVIGEITDVTSFVGAASGEHLDSYMYPKGTEFLHTVRYLGIDERGRIGPSTRMKEVRYMRKWQIANKQVYARTYQLEQYSKELGNLPHFAYLGDNGLDNGFGWSVQGFIENAHGELRNATYEENLYCMGCHSSVGATIDKTFGFPRKVDGAAGWGYINLVGMPDAPNVGDSEGEIATYLHRVGGGGEFRNNQEMYDRWFTDQGELDWAKVRSAKDVYELVTPSVPRAMALNKAYRTIVADQDYIFGRDAVLAPPKNVYDKVDNLTAPTLPVERFFQWDIRLAWTTPTVQTPVPATVAKNDSE